ncbi:MAG: menaquinone biosynthesis protein [Nitrospirota bacterium]
MTGVEGKRSLLKIGKVPYSNLFPIFYILEKQCDCSGYEFIEGFPSTLNWLLRSGQIDISPSSSIEYLRYKNKYTFIKGHSISSKGPVGSILLLSRRPIEELEGKTVLTSSQSETSVVLLDVILKKFYKIECPLKPTDEKVDLLLNKAGAFLSIGDDALKARKIVTSHTLGWGDIYIYDLGDLWYRNTGLPFVFALWIVRKGCFTEKAELLKRFIHDLNKAKGLAMENLDKIAQALRPLLLSRYSLIITEEELIPYWKGISYDFIEEHERGLKLFRRYSEELGLL